MPTEREKKQAARKAVAVRMAGAFGKEPVLLFAARQAEEVLPQADVQPLPFAPDWLLGLSVWRRQLLPVLDAAKLYGFDPVVGRPLYLVLRTVAPAETKDGSRRLLRCLLKVSSQVAAREMSAQPPAVSAVENGIDPNLVTGVFAHEDGLLIVPNLLPALCSAADS
jgi:chemotaxis signal transduction protein